MNLFVLANLIGQGIAGVVLGWTGMKAGVQWCYGIQGIALAVGAAMCFTMLSETRSDVLLARRAAQLTKTTGIQHVGPKAHHASLATMIRISCVRPIRELSLCSQTDFQNSC